MELVSPAGNFEKLKTAYLFGADAAYIGIKDFSLRAKADNFSSDDYERLDEVRIPGRKLYCACNIYFHDDDIRRLEENLEYLKAYRFDAFIISDIGIVPLIKKHFPGIPLHLSTQANCINTEAAKQYRDMGFSRIIPGRELNLKEIEQIRVKAGIQIEVFVHGAICLAYSGRCFLSAYMADRSANKGDCAHACRWKYRLLEEEERKGEYFPVYEGDNYTIILSSKDLCMIDHLPELKNAGVDAIKIEGRMKSLYYTAITTRAYRKAIDALSRGDGGDRKAITGQGDGGTEVKALDKFRGTEAGLDACKEELYKVSQREFSTGFFFNKRDMETPTKKSYIRPYDFLGCIGGKTGPCLYVLEVKNQIRTGDILEYVGYDILYIKDTSFILFDEDMKQVEKADHGKIYFIQTKASIKEGYLIRRKRCAGA
ncbi:MAG: U32 family peptidase C-terminal domain-containing protein [Spirochaetales bacterium]|nr:U32 family peptidase C-terminal domain-containing protein [Spirochaetales bacterium]